MTEAKLRHAEKHADAMERQRDELVTAKRLAEQRTADLEKQLDEANADAQTKQRRIDEMSKLVEKTIVMEEQLNARRDETIEHRVKAEQLEKRLTDQSATLERTRTDLNNANQINAELSAKIEQAERVLAANRQRSEAQTVLDAAA